MKKLTILLLFLSNYAFAHPVTFKDGQEISYIYSPLFEKFNYHYSFSSKDSLGVSFLKMEEKYYLVEYNRLLIRKNTKESQSNLYMNLSSGFNKNNWVIGGSLEADAETRRLYSMAKIMIQDKEIMGIAKVGFAPVLASYKEVQPWILLQYQRDQETDNLGPALRVMYQNYLVEVSFTENKFYGSLMIHF